MPGCRNDPVGAPRARAQQGTARPWDHGGSATHLESFILDQNRGPIRTPMQEWLCKGYCPFAGREFCPNADIEEAYVNDGASPEEAFAAALTYPMILSEPEVAPISAIDAQNIDHFFWKQRGEAPANKPVRPRAPRKSTKRSTEEGYADPAEAAPPEREKPKRKSKKTVTI